MPDLQMTAVIEYGGYISLVKFVPYVVLFFLWLPLVSWVNEDSEAVGADKTMWTWIVFGTGAAALFFWVLLPYFVGLGFFILGTAGTAVAYIIHRNNSVQEHDKVLTGDHIKGLFVKEDKKLNKLKGFVFITANKNEVPMPQPKTEDFLGYKTTYDVFVDAIWRRADNISFSPGSDGYQVVYSIDGVAAAQPSIDKDRMDSFISFIKKIANLDEKEKRKPQKGKFKIKQDNERSEWEVVTAGSTAGEQVKVKRIRLDDSLRLEELGLSSSQYDQLSHLGKRKSGVFLVTGTAKNGVTTTFYALLRNHDAFLNSINTLEKQPLGELPNVVQEIYNLNDSGTTSYAKKLARIVRMGPDIVGVGDCIDQETAQISCEGAKSKVLYVVLKAESVLQALSIWIKLAGDRNLAVDSLTGISNQRIMRKLCPDCKQAYEPNPELLRKFNLSAEKAKVLYRAGKVEYDKHGKPYTCETCQGSGYVGREGIFETIILNDELRKFIKYSKTLADIGARFRTEKMYYLQEQALKKVLSGVTAVNEMVRVLAEPQPKKKPEEKS